MSVVEEPSSSAAPSTSAPADSTMDSSGQPDPGPSSSDGGEPKRSATGEAIAVGESKDAGPAKPEVSTDIPSIERHDYRPSLCNFRAKRVLASVTKRQALYDRLSSFDWKVPLDGVVDEVLREASPFASSFDEIPLGGYLRDAGAELSLCPYCFETLIPGRGLHFLVDLVLDESTYSPTASVDKMRWHWQSYWIRNRREPTDWRELRTYLRYIRRTVGEIVRDTDSKVEFPKRWVEKYRASVWRELPRQYTYVLFRRGLR